jgi:hypothetical protein
LRGSRFRPARLAAGKLGVVRDAPRHYPESIKARVIALRDEYERIFVRLIDDLLLRSDIDKHYLRLTMIGALSLGAVLVQERQGRCSCSHCEADSIVTSLGIAPTQKPVNIR